MPTSISSFFAACFRDAPRAAATVALLFVTATHVWSAEPVVGPSWPWPESVEPSQFLVGDRVGELVVRGRDFDPSIRVYFSANSLNEWIEWIWPVTSMRFISSEELRVTLPADFTARPFQGELWLYSPLADGVLLGGFPLSVGLPGGVGPAAPPALTGPAQGTAWTPVEFRVGGGACPSAEALQYQLVLGDGRTTGWIDALAAPVASRAGVPAPAGALATAPALEEAVRSQAIGDVERILAKSDAAESRRVLLGLVGRDEAGGNGTGEAALEAELAAAGGAVHRRYGELPLLAISAGDEALRRLARNPAVRRVWEDEVITLAPGDLHSDAPAGDPADETPAFPFPRFAHGEGTVVAVVSNGVDPRHPALQGHVVEEACFSTTDKKLGTESMCHDGAPQETGPFSAENSCYMVDCVVGTHLAGMVSGDYSLSRESQLIAVQVASRGWGRKWCGLPALGCTVMFLSDTLAGLNHVADLAERLPLVAVTASFASGLYRDDCADHPAAPVLAKLRSRGVIPVLPVGDQAVLEFMGGPACAPSALAVTDGWRSRLVADLEARGDRISSTSPFGGRIELSGSAQAAATTVAGISVLRSTFPDKSAEEVVSAILSSGIQASYESLPGARPYFALDRIADALVGRWEATIPVTWGVPGSYEVSARSRCRTHIEAVSELSAPVVVQIAPAEPEQLEPPTMVWPLVAAPRVEERVDFLLSPDSRGGEVQSQIDFGDGTMTGWLRPQSSSARHAWPAAGSFAVRARVRSTRDPAVTSDWSEPTLLEVSTGGGRISAPFRPEGPTRLQTGEPATFRARGADAGGAPVRHRFEFGDGSYAWVDGEPAEARHTYLASGTFEVRAIAEADGTIQVWSEPLIVEVTRPKAAEVSGSWSAPRSSCKTRSGARTCTVSATLTLKNHGESSANDVRVSATLLLDPTLPHAAGIPLERRSVKQIPAGGTGRVKYTVTMPAGFDPRGLHASATWEVSGAWEHDESDNAALSAPVR